MRHYAVKSSVFMSEKSGFMELGLFLTRNVDLDDHYIALFWVGGCIFPSSKCNGLQHQLNFCTLDATKIEFST